MKNLPIVITDIAGIAANPGAVPWPPFRDGVELHRLYGSGEAGASAALLRYAPGARVPTHVHPGYEHILVLAGSQVDERGVHGTGTLVVNPPGSSHSVSSPEGCIVLAIWEQPVAFVEG